MSANNIVVIKKEVDGKFRGYHRDYDAYCEGQYNEGLCPICHGEFQGFCDACDGKGYYTPPKETPIFEVNTIEEAIHAYDKWCQEMLERDEFGTFCVEYGYTFEGLEPNELAIKTLKRSERGEDVHKFSNVDDLLKELEVDSDADTKLLNFLQEQTDKADYTGKVICRKSTTGRGWRLYETSEGDAVSDVRQAIRNYMEQVKKEIKDVI